MSKLNKLIHSLLYIFIFAFVANLYVILKKILDSVKHLYYLQGLQSSSPASNAFSAHLNLSALLIIVLLIALLLILKKVVNWLNGEQSKDTEKSKGKTI